VNHSTANEDEAEAPRHLVNPLRAQLRLMGAIFGSLVLLGLAVAGVLRHNQLAVILGLTLAGCMAFVLLFVTFCMAVFVIPKADRELAAFGRGEYLAHWTWTPEEWERFVRTEKRSWRACVWIVPLAMFLIAGACAVWGDEDGSLLASIFAALGGVMTIVAWAVATSRKRFFERGRRSRPHAYIGPLSLYFNGAYHSWTSFGTSLGGVQLIDGPPLMVEFRLEVGDYSSEVWVPVPAGREEEARRLVHAFRSLT
jgi:hypothetical protein